MRWLFYIFIISYLASFLNAFADKFRNDNALKWEKVQENKSNNLKKVIWKAFNDDESYFDKVNLKNYAQKESETQQEKRKLLTLRKESNEMLEIIPHVPLNNYLNYGDFVSLQVGNRLLVVDKVVEEEVGTRIYR